MVARWHLGDDSALTESIPAALDTTETVRASEFWQRVSSAEERLTEVPIGAPWDDQVPPRVLAKGIIDLILRTPEGWQIIDYKTDVLSLDQLVSSTASNCGLMPEFGKDHRPAGFVRWHLFGSGVEVEQRCSRCRVDCLKRTKIMYAEELKYALRAAQAAGDLLRDGFHAGFPESLDKAADECIIGWFRLRSLHSATTAAASREANARLMQRDADWLAVVPHWRACRLVQWRNGRIG